MLSVEPLVKVIIPDGNDCLFDVVARAKNAGMHVVSNGKMIILCSVIPVGWKRMNWVKSRPADDNRGYYPKNGGVTALPSTLEPAKLARQ